MTAPDPVADMRRTHLVQLCNCAPWKSAAKAEPREISVGVIFRFGTSFQGIRGVAVGAPIGPARQ